MRKLGHQVKPKLKYKICAERTSGYAYPIRIMATVTLADPASKYIYTKWVAKTGFGSIPYSDNTACYIAIGITRG